MRTSDLIIREMLSSARKGERTLVMGALNVTPDSFSDGGRYLSPEKAVAHGMMMAEEGADILDIGGESTRPDTFRNHSPLDPAIEMERILPVIRELSERLPEIPISVDTYKAVTARGAVEAGAAMINDISALRADAKMAETAASLNVPVCLMHIPGLPTDIPEFPPNVNIVTEVVNHLIQRISAAKEAGIQDEMIIIDPGIGFGKNAFENLEILRRLREIADLGYPVLIGVSRKSTIGKVLGGLPPEDRLEGTAAAIAISIAGGASIVRVHDVKQMARVARMSDAIVRGWREAWL